MSLSIIPIEETGETRVKIDCLNFDVSLCIQISVRGRRHWQGPSLLDNVGENKLCVICHTNIILLFAFQWCHPCSLNRRTSFL